MIATLFNIVLLVGFAFLTINAVRGLWTGRLELSGKIDDLVDMPPILRAERPVAFWLGWLSVASFTLFPLLWITFNLIVLF